MRRKITRSIFCLGLVLAGCLWAPGVIAQNNLQQAFPNLSFTNPIDLQNAGDGSDRLFVVEQRGGIFVFRNDPATTSKKVFMDIRERVDDTGFEQGLLGLAFHPDYETNGYFYVNYTAKDPHRTVVSRFQVTADRNVADPASELVLFEIYDPYENHNGGQLAFGPDDGYLYISTGDGGSFGDPKCRAQDNTQLLGKMVRIDVDNSSGNHNYGIPADNPFVGNTDGYREEIYAYGLRNPWRFSFDAMTGLLWCGDVGQDLWEEINIIENGGNYGWAIMEASHCYASPWSCAPACDPTGLIPPVWEYSHSEGVAITGGYVYRGSAVPELTGKYIYTDWLSGVIWSLEYDGINPPVNTELLTASVSSSAFGVDEQNELYLCGLDGMIYSFVPATSIHATNDNETPVRTSLIGNSPNPFNPSTRITYQLQQGDHVVLTIHNILGQRVRTLVDGFQTTGTQSAVWDGRNADGSSASSGLYFCRLEAGTTVQTQKMLLTK